MIVKDKPAQFLVEVKLLNKEFSKEDPTATNIASRIDSTYAHTVRITDQLEASGLITRTPEGRCKMIKLTSSGEKVSEKVSNLLKTINEEVEA